MAITRRSAQITPKVELFGDWDKANKLMKNLPMAIRIGSSIGQEVALRELKKMIKRNIRENGGSLGWKPLSKRTLKNKKKSKHPTAILRMTGLYYRSITTWKNETTNTHYLGVKPRVRYKKKNGKDGLTLTQVANILEYGKGDIPARPLWVPTFKQFGGNLRIKGFILWHVRNQIKIQCGVNAKVNF